MIQMVKVAKTRRFLDRNGRGLVVKQRKSKVILEVDDENYLKDHRIRFYFDERSLEKIHQHFFDVATLSWPGIEPKEEDSFASDYTEYYDKEFDSNGYFYSNENGFTIERANEDARVKLYQFNKRKMQAYLYDLKSKGVGE